jgi:hypothetical protein
MQAVGTAAITAAAVVAFLLFVRWSQRLLDERVAVLTGLVGEPILIGLSRGRMVLPFHAVIASVDGRRSLRFASLEFALPPGRWDFDWSRWVGVDDDGRIWLVQVLWAEAADGTRWHW